MSLSGDWGDRLFLYVFVVLCILLMETWVKNRFVRECGSGGLSELRGAWGRRELGVGVGRDGFFSVERRVFFFGFFVG